MIAVIGVIASGIVSLLSSTIVRWLALKAVLFALFTVVLPIIMFKGWLLIQTWFFNYLSSQLATQSGSVFASPQFIELTGVAAYLGTHLRLAEGVSILIGAALMAFTISLIKR